MSVRRLPLPQGPPVLRATTVGTLIGGSIAGAIFLISTVYALATPPYNDRHAAALFTFTLGYLLLFALAGALVGAVTGLFVGAIGWRRPRR
jgi:hypothetical protein